MVDSNNVELGFVEKTDSHLLCSFHFPSKVGGKPSWLSLSPLPSNKDLECSKCGKILSFLMQVYCPFEESPKAFHRALFVFVCRNVVCCSKNNNENFCVLRSQLPRNNDFYSPEPPKKETDGPSAKFYQDLCVVCGLRGSKRCARCQSATYCSKEHQEADWKTGHKAVCKSNVPTPASAETVSRIKVYPDCNFPEYELITEPEILPNETEKEKSEEDKLKEYEEFMKSKAAESVLPDSAAKDLEKMAVSDNSQDQVFMKFKERIQDEQEQVLRYQRNGMPLWVSECHIPKDGDIPNCSCGLPRTFEFQIMPQLLTYLEVDSLGDSIDWGTLCIYTCSGSCDIGNNYHKEFLWKQDFSDSNI
ncbi:TSR4 [Mytilus coruscus]|uniref:TSR4 n=1 Tax=Mytilus coruscus TaxID=42192 RepID=A0A6J8D6L3_MYTCO|nr:TSR4 [Mytilus coruscus]